MRVTTVDDRCRLFFRLVLDDFEFLHSSDPGEHLGARGERPGDVLGGPGGVRGGRGVPGKHLGESGEAPGDVMGAPGAVRGAPGDRLAVSGTRFGSR
jgi:hypothetical protein